MLLPSRVVIAFFFSSRRRHTISLCDWSSDVCSSDLIGDPVQQWFARGLGQTGWFGWYQDEEIEKLSRAWLLSQTPAEIGRASCRERVEISVVAVSLKTQRKGTSETDTKSHTRTGVED